MQNRTPYNAVPTILKGDFVTRHSSAKYFSSNLVSRVKQTGFMKLSLAPKDTLKEDLKYCGNQWIDEHVSTCIRVERLIDGVWTVIYQDERELQVVSWWCD